MEKNNCTLTGHTYDIWNLYDETHVSRKCINCNHIEILPQEIDTLKQIKLQQEALQPFSNFLNLDVNDSNIIFHLNEIINKYFSFLSQENKIKLALKLNEIVLTSSLSEEIKQLLQEFINSNYFKLYNKELLTNQTFETKISPKTK